MFSVVKIQLQSLRETVSNFIKAIEKKEQEEKKLKATATTTAKPSAKAKPSSKKALPKGEFDDYVSDE